MYVLLIGGTGPIGRHVVQQLAGAGHEVTVYHRGQTECDLPSAVRHVHDLRAAIPVVFFPQDLLNHPPDVVIHMIAMTQADAEAAVHAFAGRARRLVVASSGDVYRAYGRFTGLEPGPVEASLLSEDSPLRTVLYPYRSQSLPGQEWMRDYEKLLVERTVLGCKDLPGTVLRLPKVYGPGTNADLRTVYGAWHRPQWRWTHGYVENVAAAITLAAIHPAAGGRVYNVGEAYTPTVEERLRGLPVSSLPADENHFHYEHDIAYDTSRIRIELGYREPVDNAEGLRLTLDRNRADFA
jgi:nucleoside-diphosphate-sugar epimerase